MVEIFGWIRRHLRYPHDRKPRNVLVTFNDTNEVQWRTEREAEKMIEKGTVNFVTPQNGKTTCYSQSAKSSGVPEIDS